MTHLPFLGDSGQTATRSDLLSELVELVGVRVERLELLL